MERDLRGTPLYKEIEQFYRRTHEPAFGRISGAADPAPSPDGRSIAFTGSMLEKLEGTPVTRICLVPASGGQVEQITGGPNDDRLPRWSPDGSRLAFLSDRKEQGRSQLYLLDADRLGEARPTPTVDGTAEYLAWAPDGRSILLGVAGSGADLAGVQGSGTTKEAEGDAPGWLPRVQGTGSENEWRRLWRFDLGAGETTPLSREELNVWEAVWCGNDIIAAIVSDDPSENAWYDAALALIDVESGKERILYRAQDGRQIGLPAASSDGGTLAVVQAICSDRLIVAGDLLLVDQTTGEATPIDTRGIDVTHLAWRTNQRLILSGLRGQQTVVSELDSSTGSLNERWATDETCGSFYPESQPIGSSGIAMVRSAYRRHPDIVVLDDGEPRQVASLEHDGSGYLDSVSGTIEEVSWRSPDGLDISGLLIRPGGAPPFRLVTLVHGGPVAMTRNTRAQWLAPLLASRGYAVLMPNPRGSSGRGQAFAEMVYGDMGGRDAEDILAGVDVMVERGIADPDRLGVIGGSYGGFMSCWLISRTERFAAAVAISPVTDWYSQHFASNIGAWDVRILKDHPGTAGGEYLARSPVVFADRVRTPTLLTAGDVDECTPPGQAVEFYRALRERGVEAELALYPGEGHGVRKFPAQIDFSARVVGWFERLMPAKP